MTDTTDDGLVITNAQRDQFYGISAPQNKSQLNSLKAKYISTGQIYCSGDMALYGNVTTPLNLLKGIQFGDGSAAHPSITFTNDPTTGLYLSSTGVLGFSSEGVQSALLSDSTFVTPNIITTASGDLLLNPAGTNIDCTGHNLINVGGISITVGSPNQVIINNSLGQLTSEAHLATVRGGTATDSSSATGIAHVNSGTWTYAPITDGDFGTITNFTAANISANTILQTPISIMGGQYATYVANLTTTNNSSHLLIGLPTIAQTSYILRGDITLGDSTGGSNTGAYSFFCKAKNIGGVLTISNLVNEIMILDGALTTTAIAVIGSGTQIDINVSGLSSTNINWIGTIHVTSQQF